MKKGKVMHAIEFIGHMEDGAVKIPKEYQAQLNDKFRIIILQDESTEVQETKKKRSLNAVRITTKDLKFDRDEANTR